MPTPVKIRSAPGIKRDGTKLDGDNYIEGLWCRFVRGLPRKMAGYRMVTDTLPELVYGMHMYPKDGVQYTHLGSATKLTQILMDPLGNLTGFADRTPAAFPNSVNNVWQFDLMFDDIGSAINLLLAHAGQNLDNIDNSVVTPVWYGDVAASGALVALPSAFDCSGGIVVLAPHLITYGSGGRVAMSASGDPTGSSGLGNEAFVCGTKIVKGLPLRGNGDGASGLFWALDCVIRATYAGGTGLFAFDTLAGQSSVLSSRGIVDYDGVFYWWGIDRPLMFNGVVQEVPNPYNKDWFLNNVNMTQRQKVFAFKVPRWGEIWWCFPFGNATECTHAIIYNTLGRFWYDTALPTAVQAGMGRTDGFYAQTSAKPFMCDQYPNGSLTDYGLWQHETGVDSVRSSDVQPIPSFFQTAEISMLTVEQAASKALHVAMVEPDFVQAGQMTMHVTGRQNARAPEIAGPVHAFPAVATRPEEQTIPIKETRRLMSFRFASNVVGGDYEMGETLAHIQPDEGRART